MKREITSHPAPFLLNYSNLTRMDRPPWQEAAGGEERGSLLWEITHLISEWGKNRQIWWVVPLGVQPGLCGGDGTKETTRSSRPLHLPLLMTSASAEQCTRLAPTCRSPSYSALRSQRYAWQPNSFNTLVRKYNNKNNNNTTRLTSLKPESIFHTADFHTLFRV